MELGSLPKRHGKLSQLLNISHQRFVFSQGQNQSGKQTGPRTRPTNLPKQETQPPPDSNSSSFETLVVQNLSINAEGDEEKVEEVIKCCHGHRY